MIRIAFSPQAPFDADVFGDPGLDGSIYRANAFCPFGAAAHTGVARTECSATRVEVSGSKAQVHW
jgi:hypothetical protein